MSSTCLLSLFILCVMLHTNLSDRLLIDKLIVDNDVKVFITCGNLMKIMYRPNVFYKILNFYSKNITSAKFEMSQLVPRISISLSETLGLSNKELHCHFPCYIGKQITYIVHISIVTTAVIISVHTNNILQCEKIVSKLNKF